MAKAKEKKPTPRRNTKPEIEPLKAALNALCDHCESHKDLLADIPVSKRLETPVTICLDCLGRASDVIRVASEEKLKGAFRALDVASRLLDATKVFLTQDNPTGKPKLITWVAIDEYTWKSSDQEDHYSVACEGIRGGCWIAYHKNEELTQGGHFTSRDDAMATCEEHLLAWLKGISKVNAKINDSINAVKKALNFDVC